MLTDQQAMGGSAGTAVAEAPPKKFLVMIDKKGEVKRAHVMEGTTVAQAAVLVGHCGNENEARQATFTRSVGKNQPKMTADDTITKRMCLTMES